MTVFDQPKTMDLCRATLIRTSWVRFLMCGSRRTRKWAIFPKPHIIETSTTSSQDFHQGRIRFCALILDFDEKLIFNGKCTINSWKTRYYWPKIKNMSPENAKNLIFRQNASQDGKRRNHDEVRQPAVAEIILWCPPWYKYSLQFHVR